jgi:F0F1-type ATP synthase delta subunit
MQLLPKVEPLVTKFINKDNYNLELDQLQANFQKLSPTLVYTAIDLDPTHLQSLGAWFKQNFGNQAIFDHQVDPKLIGGIAVVKNGRYQDYSLLGKIESHKPEIIADFKNTLKS